MRVIAVFGLLLVCLLSVSSAGAQEVETSGDTETASGPTRYIDLKPAFIVNYGGVGRLRYLKTDISLRIDSGEEGVIRHHMPYIRDRLVKVLSDATDEEVSSTEGREMLRQQALKTVRELLVKEEGEQHVVDLLFNSFVIQR